MKIFSRLFLPLIHVHIFIAAVAAAVCLTVWIRQTVYMTGDQVFSLSMLLAVILICMASGASYFGKAADRKSHPERYWIYFHLLFAGYTVASPFLLRLVNRTIMILTQALPAGLFGAQAFRVIFTFLFFIVPCTLAGGMIPVYGRYLVRHMSQAGRRAGGMLASMAAGMAVGCLLFDMMPYWALSTSDMLQTAFWMWIANLVPALLVNLPVTHSPAGRLARLVRYGVRRHRPRLMKNKVVLETVTKLIHTLPLNFQLQGFVTMGFIVLWTRALLITLPHAGWMPAKLIMTFLAGIAFGSFLFRWIADYTRTRFLWLALLEILLSVSALLSFIYSFKSGYYIQKHLAEKQAFFLFSQDVIGISVLVAVPSVLTGAIFTMAMKIVPGRLNTCGEDTGRFLFTWLTGSVAALLLVSFLFIPAAGLYRSFFLVSVLSALTGILILFRDSRLKRGFRVLCFAGTVGAMIWAANIFDREDIVTRHPDPASAGGNVAMMREGSSSLAVLMEKDNGEQDLLLNGVAVAGTDEKQLQFQYLQTLLPFLFSKQTASVCLMGFGTGIQAAVIEKWGSERITVAEPSPELIRLSSEAFSLLNDDVLTKKNLDITTESGRSLLNRYHEAFDIIICRYSHPKRQPGLYTSDFYKLCKDRLDESGMLCQSLPLYGLTAQEFGSLVRSCTEVFAHVSLWWPGNEHVLLLASAQMPSYGFCALDERFFRLTAGYRNFAGSMNSLESLLGHLIAYDDQLKTITGETRPHTDDLTALTRTGVDISGENDSRVMQVLSSATGQGSYIRFEGNCRSDTSAIRERISRIHDNLIRKNPAQ